MAEEKPIEDALDGWLGFNEPPKSKEKVKPGGKLDVREAVAFVERGAMSEAQLAIGLLGISYEAKQLLAGGLTEDALFTLIEAKAKHNKNGKKPSAETIGIVLRAVSELDQYVDRDALEKVRAARRAKP